MKSQLFAFIMHLGSLAIMTAVVVCFCGEGCLLLFGGHTQDNYCRAGAREGGSSRTLLISRVAGTKDLLSCHRVRAAVPRCVI